MPRTKGSKNRPKFTPLLYNRLEDDEQLSFDDAVATAAESMLVEPKEAFKFVESYEVTNSMEIKNVLRPINSGNISIIENGAAGIKGLNEYLREGWKLFSTHYVGELQPDGHMMLYIFLREVSAS